MSGAATGVNTAFCRIIGTVSTENTKSGMIADGLADFGVKCFSDAA